MPQITPLTGDDHDEWLALWHGYLEFYEARLDAATTSATFERLLDDEDLHGALLRDDAGVALGLVHWLTHPATWSTDDDCYLEDLFVAPAGRGRGAGRTLIEHVRAWASSRGCAKVYWLTAESNATARALYDRVAARSGMIHYQIPLG
ncbi:GNAT family N-acetyltransferase [Microbacterium sp. SA39]|uniref:GNAT family N-acetyltransferase n=1 Tax=Microbacterium sp. SA39 TaxID=1263625 RepID=UPI0005F9AD85|nr:GNAT family N-acetyltransferase [Microbacterium sp. SA39]KJQ52554.1 putative acetyltransferase [Microbacterium sp. SA39]